MTRRGFFAALLALPIAARAALSAPRKIWPHTFGCVSPGTVVNVEPYWKHVEFMRGDQWPRTFYIGNRATIDKYRELTRADRRYGA